MRGLTVLVDGVALPEDEARAMWERFSAWMEEHRGDLAGFAKQEGFASIHPGVDEGRPVLQASHKAAQRPYAPVAQSAPRTEGSNGGSRVRHEAPGDRRQRPPKRRK